MIKTQGKGQRLPIESHVVFWPINTAYANGRTPEQKLEWRPFLNLMTYRIYNKIDEEAKNLFERTIYVKKVHSSIEKKLLSAVD